MNQPRAELRLRTVVSRIMPRPDVPLELADGPASVRIGPGEPRVRLIVRDRRALKKLLLRHQPLVAFALAYADGALDVDGDVLDLARIKGNFAQPPLGFVERLRIAWAVLRW